MQAFARIDAIPAAADHRLAVIGRDRGHDLVPRVVAPGEPRRRRRLHRIDHGGEEIRRLHDIHRQGAAFQECRQRCLRLWPVDAVDWRCVIARDHEQPLDAGEPRLLVVIFRVFGQVRHEVAVVGSRRGDLGKGYRRLPGAALPGGCDHEIVWRDAQRVAAVLRDRRGAIDPERACVQQNAVRRQRALHHHAAGGGIDPEPAACRGRSFVIDADRGLDHIAHAVAELEIRKCRRRRSKERKHRRRKRHEEAGQTGARLSRFRLVMAGLDPPAGPKPLRRGEGPAIHVFLSAARKQGADGRNDSGRDGLFSRRRFAHHLWISVPVPWLVNNSSSTACWVLPSMMTTPCTPCSSA